jgi:hypothetical protein
MRTLEEMRNRVWDLLDSGPSDRHHPGPFIDDALNEALAEAVVRLRHTVGRGRFARVVSDVKATAAFNEDTMIYTAPSDFRKVITFDLDGAPLDGAADFQELDSAGLKFLVVNSQIHFSKSLPLGPPLRLHYEYVPSRMLSDADTPDWFEGLENYLIYKACTERLLKGDDHDPRVFESKARLMWPAIEAAARSSGMATAKLKGRRSRWERYL